MSDKLIKIASDITDEANRIVDIVGKSRLKIGNLLVEARDEFPGDNEFGKWRQEALPFLKQRETSKLIGHAKLIAERPTLAALPESTGFALLSASDELLDRVEETVEDPDQPNPSRRDVERQTKSDDAPPPPAKRPPVLATSGADIVGMAMAPRIEALEGRKKDSEWAYQIIGLDPNPQCAPNEQSVIAIVDRMQESADEVEMAAIDVALMVIEADRREF